MNEWVISDTHYFQDSLVSSGIREEGYGDKINKYWRNMIHNDDLVIHLGDIMWKRHSELTSILERLPGKKILCLGNHDEHSTAWYYKAGFSFVCDYFVRNNVLFSHKPMSIPKEAKWNVHGHIHIGNHAEYEPEITALLSSKHKMVSLEESGYKPILLKHLLV